MNQRLFIIKNRFNPVEISKEFFFIMGVILFIVGIISAVLRYMKDEVKKRELKPICEYCRFVALNDRDLHNHQLVCEKKKSENS